MNLIETLRAIEASPEIAAVEWLTDGEHDELHPLVRQAVDAACSELIDRHGRCQNLGVVRAAGFGIGPGEQDSFGWLSGVIRTSKGKVVYG